MLLFIRAYYGKNTILDTFKHKR